MKKSLPLLVTLALAGCPNTNTIQSANKAGTNQQALGLDLSTPERAHKTLVRLANEGDLEAFKKCMYNPRKAETYMENYKTLDEDCTVQEFSSPNKGANVSVSDTDGSGGYILVFEEKKGVGYLLSH